MVIIYQPFHPENPLSVGKCKRILRKTTDGNLTPNYAPSIACRSVGKGKYHEISILHSENQVLILKLNRRIKDQMPRLLEGAVYLRSPFIRINTVNKINDLSICIY
uniref:Uncharacterized protein n=1 Tax=Romanomermis culicivorax TaxID=13658 RepID=A0A915JZZ5_ROMCU